MTDPEVESKSVIIWGNSVGVFVAGQRTTEGPWRTYPAVLAASKVTGSKFSVVNKCRVAGFITDVRGQWLTEASILRPDIVVLQFGAYEAFPRLPPRPLVRHLMGVNRRASAWRNPYWNRAGRLLNWFSRKAGQLDPYLPESIGGYVTCPRFEAELRLQCQRLQRQVGCRIVLADAYPMASYSPANTPKMKLRLARNNATIRRVASDFGLEVFPLAQTVVELGGDEVLGDGLHLTDAAHAVVGEKLARFLGSASRPD
jgi:hypothetical protein